MRHFISENDTSNLQEVAELDQLQPYIDFINHKTTDIPILLTNPVLRSNFSFPSAEKNTVTGLYGLKGNTLNTLEKMLKTYMLSANLVYTESEVRKSRGDKNELTYYDGVLKAGITKETYGFTHFNVCQISETTYDAISFIGFQTSNGSEHLNFNAPYVLFELKFNDALKADELYVFATPDRFSVGIGQPDGTSIADRSKMFSFYLEPRVTLVRYKEYDDPYLDAYAFKINWNTN